MFISVEGGEGAGKSTLLEKLSTFFRQKGKDVLQTYEPGGTKIGEEIRALLLHKKMDPRTELFLFLSDRVQHIQEVIRPALVQGKVVLCDRFNDSTIAYQGCGRELGWEWVERICQEACENVEPDITIFLDIDPEVGRKRLQHEWDRLEKEEIAFHHRVREGFHYLFQKYPERIHRIDAAQSPDDVWEEASHFLY